MRLYPVLGLFDLSGIDKQQPFMLPSAGGVVRNDGSQVSSAHVTIQPMEMLQAIIQASANWTGHCDTAFYTCRTWIAKWFFVGIYVNRMWIGTRSFAGLRY
jgi:hypothetical protein